MTRIDVVRQEMMKAMKAREKERKDALSALLTALKNAAINKREDLIKEEEDTIVLKEIRQLNETLESAPENRTDIIQECKFRISVLSEFAPKMLNREEISNLLEEILTNLGFTQGNSPTIKEKGKIMKELMPKVKGKADGKLVSQVVEERLK